MYRLLLQLAGDNGELSVKEVEIMFLRDWCERFGFKCEHPHKRIVYSINTGIPYCKDCWRRLEKKQVGVLENGRLVKKIYYEEIETFVDRWNHDNQSLSVSESKGKQQDEKQQKDLDEQVKEDLK
jgi:hypothetical protein